MPIDQQLLIPTLATSSGEPSITIAQLVALMDGESLPLIDQALLIPTLKGRAGLPAETIADIVALANGGPPAVTTTSSLLESYDVANWWALNQQSGDIFGNCGFRPVAGVPFVVAPDSADSIPMASEPTNTATFFDGTAQCLEAGPPDVKIPYTLATNVVFLKAASFAVSVVFWSHGTTGGAVDTRLQTNTSTGFLAVIGDSGGARYICELVLPAAIVVDRWHMLGWRQPVDGNGLDWFFDGTFFANSSAEVVNFLDGGADVDFSFNNANTAGADRFTAGSDSNTALGLKLTGSMFHIIIDDKVWTNTQLTDLWEQAIASGLNA